MRSAGPSAFVAVIIYSILVSSTSFGEQIGKCSLNPSSWCNNLSNAKECQATQHCIENVWEKRSVPLDTSPVCQLCKDMISQARNKLQGNNFETELLQISEKSYKQIPMLKIQKEWRKLTANSLPELTEILSSKMSNDQTCTVVGLCNNVSIDALLMEGYRGALDGTLDIKDYELEESAKRRTIRSVAQPDQLSCSTCNILTLALRQKFESIKRDDMLEGFLDFCYTLQSYSEVCANIVVNNFDDFFELARDQLQSNELCHVVNICEKPMSVEEEQEAFDVLAKNSPFYCDLCKQVVSHVRKAMKDLSEAKFKAMMLANCKKMRGYEAQCLKDVDQYSHIIYTLLKSQLNPEGVCQLMHICPNPKSNVEEQQQQLDVVDDELSNELIAIDAPMLPQCFLCKTAFRMAKRLVRSHTSNEQLKNAMNKGCNILGKIANKCHRLINRHGDQMVRFAKNPRVLCTMLGMCFPIAEDEEQVELEVEQLQSTELAYQQTGRCKLCKKTIKTLLNLNKILKDIKVSLEHVCGVFKERPMRLECEQMTKQHANLIIELVQKKLTRQEICRNLNMCLLFEEAEEDLNEIDDEAEDQSEIEEYLAETDLDVGASPKCSLCRAAMKALQHMVRNRADRGSIQRAMNKCCDRMGALKGRCQRMVQRHGNKIVDLMTKKTGGQRICKLIGVCRMSASEEEYALAVQQNAVVELENDLVEYVEGTPKCSLCRTAIRALQHIVKNRADRGSIQRAMQRCCDRLGALKGRCERMVQRHGNKIVDLMTQKMPAGRICKMIGMCKMSASEEEFENEEALAVQQNALVEFEYDLVDYVEGTPKCSLCRTAIRALQHIVKNRADRGSIQRAMHRCCDRLGALKGRCERMVQRHGNKIVDLMTQKMPAGRICKMIGMCKSSVEDEDFYTEIELALSEDLLISENQNNEVMEVKPKEAPVCLFCEIFISKFQALVNTKAKREQIMQKLLLTCNVMPSPIREPCRNAALLYGTVIFDLLSTSTPKEVCGFVHFCFSKEEYDQLEAFLNMTMDDNSEELQLAELQGGPICIICELLVARFERLLDTKAKRDHILHSILNITNFLPHFIRDPVQGVVYGYGAAVLDLISKVKPREVCRVMPLCVSNE